MRSKRLTSSIKSTGLLSAQRDRSVAIMKSALSGSISTAHGRFKIGSTTPSRQGMQIRMLGGYRPPARKNIVEPLLEPTQRFGRGRRPIVELELVVGASRPAGERIHGDVFERMQHCERDDHAADIGPAAIAATMGARRNKGKSAHNPTPAITASMGITNNTWRIPS